jgi:hypothetical protein
MKKKVTIGYIQVKIKSQLLKIEEETLSEYWRNSNVGGC